MVFNIADSKERRTVEALTLPYPVKKLLNVPIPMKDGKILYAHIWLPVVPDSVKVGALLEYLPYRKNDFTSIRDSVRHPYYAGHGLASIRVDMRGCGDSDDVLKGEYLLQEQEDNLAVFDWIVSQPWSNGKIGQIGKSWGGFNGLQVAYRQHPALKAIVTVCSTDDRYSDDVHYRGGCILASDMLWWASTMFAYNARPQDPQVREDWKQNWLERLEVEPNVIDWMKHQTRDEFWKHGSVCEDYSKVDIPVLAVGGWRDGYTNAVFRMMDNLPHPDCKSIIGPWVHEFPEVATPHPGLGYNQIVIQWFSKYLNDEEVASTVSSRLAVPNGFSVHNLKKLNAYVQDPCTIAGSYDYRDGKWVTKSDTKTNELRYYLSQNQLLPEAQDGFVTLSGTQEHGLFRGTWCPFGQDGDFPTDQKIEDAKCWTFDTIIDEDTHLLGFPIANVVISSDQELANLTVRLVDIDTETNEHVLMSWGVANLSHLLGTHEHPKNLVPHEKYTFSIQLDAVGYKLEKGHKVRIALSPTDWPSTWPLAKTPKLKVFGESSISLPVVEGFETIDKDLLPRAEALAPMDREILRKESRTKKIVYDCITGEWIIDDFSDEGKRLIVENGVELGSWNKNIWKIKGDDPLSAFNQCDWELTLGRGEWQTKLVTTSSMKSDSERFILYNRLRAYEGEQQIFEKEWKTDIPRNFT